MHYVYQNENNILLQVELAGVHPQNVEVILEKDELHIRAQKNTPDARLLIGEIEANSIHKTFQLDRELDTENIQATMKEGILSLTFVKRNKRKNIVVKAA